ncbi:MAG: hypothetical protein KFH98_08500 [Gemmatimonadetes bacterium]|nr:hypothetical protein [Gemmatimonadota bacterium]
MTLSSIVMAVIAGICVAQMKLARVAAEQVATAEAVRTVVSVLGGEARRMHSADVRAWSADSLAVRAFRGAGLPCGSTGGGVIVRYTGDRLPDPAKDSVLIVGAGLEYALLLFDASPAPGLCAALSGETVLELTTTGTPPQDAVLLVFESGSYHLTTNALRYRIGAGGRQPLTAEALRHPFSRFDGLTQDGVSFRIEAGGRQAMYAAMFTPSPVWP